MDAVAEWPAWARVGRDLAVEADPDTGAVTYDDGAVGQRPRATRTRYRRTVIAELGARAAEFRTWAEAHGAGPFTWRDPADGVTRQVRIAGGAAGIVYRQVRTAPGPLWWTAELRLEDAP